jgi:hypothetical protein
MLSHAKIGDNSSALISDAMGIFSTEHARSNEDLVWHTHCLLAARAEKSAKKHET